MLPHPAIDQTDIYLHKICQDRHFNACVSVYEGVCVSICVDIVCVFVPVLTVCVCVCVCGCVLCASMCYRLLSCLLALNVPCVSRTVTEGQEENRG